VPCPIVSTKASLALVPLNHQPSTCLVEGPGPSELKTHLEVRKVGAQTRVPAAAKAQEAEWLHLVLLSRGGETVGVVLRRLLEHVRQQV
jgi:hypothetical protein